MARRKSKASATADVVAEVKETTGIVREIVKINPPEEWPDPPELKYKEGDKSENQGKTATRIKNISGYKFFEILTVLIPDGEEITLTEDQEKNDRFMAIVNRGVELKMLEKV